MTYTDEDILDLYEDLKSVGMAETDGEAAVRHLKDFLAQDYLKDLALYMTPDHDQAFRMMADFLEGKGIPHSYCSVTLIDHAPGGVDVYYVFPTIFLKERAIDVLHYMKFEEDVKEERLPDAEAVRRISKSLEFYNERGEVPPYSKTNVVRTISPSWEIKPWEREDWEIKPITED
jgi:hypothetical protein